MKSESQLLEECIEVRQKHLIELKLKQASISQSMDMQPASSFNGYHNTLTEIQMQIIRLTTELEILQHEHLQKIRDIIEKEIIMGSKEEVMGVLAQSIGNSTIYKLIEVGKTSANL
jgi:hypothetical protein